MKNYPNHASDFQRIRSTLEIIDQLNMADKDATSDVVLGKHRDVGSPEVRRTPVERAQVDDDPREAA